MEVLIHEAAQKSLGKIDRKTRENITAHIKALSENPYSTRLDIKKLKGLQSKPDMFRLRIDEYRIIYLISGNKVWVTDVMIRGHGYDF